MVREQCVNIDGVTFDFWNTLYTDRPSGDSDLVRRARLAALHEAVEVCGGTSTPESIRESNSSGFAAYVEAWRGGRHYGAREHVFHVLGRLGVESCDGGVERAAQQIEELGAQADLMLLPGAAEAIPQLAAAGVRLGLISDTGLTPGRILRTFLERDGLLPHFSSLTFSDETGFPKPDPRMFQLTLDEMGVSADTSLHVGDTPRTDIAGALSMGMRAVRFAAISDTDEPPAAHAVIRDHRELLRLTREL